MTLKLTRANLYRIKEKLFHIIDTYPLFSVIGFVVIAATITGIIISYVKYSQENLLK